MPATDGVLRRDPADIAPWAETCGQIRCLVEQKDGAAAEIHHVEITDAKMHYHERTEEIYLVTKGSGELEVDGETCRVRPGDAILIPPGAWHTLENNGTSELTILCMCSPPYSHDDTFFE